MFLLFELYYNEIVLPVAVVKAQNTPKSSTDKHIEQVQQI